MKITKLQGLSVLSMLVVSTFVSCEEHNPFLEQELFNQEYSKNFFAKYGNFPADQNWDFSKLPRACATDPSVFDLGSDMGTRAHTPDGTEVSLADAKSQGILTVPSKATSSEDTWPKVSDPYYYMEEETYDWLQENLEEGRNNTTVGSPFILSYGTDDVNKFAIIPFFQGYGTVKYKLHLVSAANQKDYVIWDNWPWDDEIDVAYTKVHGTVGTEDFQWNWRDEYPAPHNSDSWQDVHKNQRLDELGQMHNSYMWYKNIRSKPMIISGLTGEFYLYMEVTQCLSQYGEIGQHHTSKEGMMIALPCPTPKNINDYKSLFGITESQTISQVMVIGCEDTKSSTDWDMNDIAFLVVGLTDLPKKREVSHSKRYLIEDMGSTVDFDFNDVVVDVTETVIVDPETKTKEIYSQEAVIRHLCGTLPFEVSFQNGGTYCGEALQTASFGTIQGRVQGVNEMYKVNKDDKTKYDANGVYLKIQYSKKAGNITGIKADKPFWNPETNNIQISVGDNDTLDGQENWSALSEYGGVKVVNFSNPGKYNEDGSYKTNAPYIIAVPTTQMWTSENAPFDVEHFVLLDETIRGEGSGIEK